MESFPKALLFCPPVWRSAVPLPANLLDLPNLSLFWTGGLDLGGLDPSGLPRLAGVG